MKSIESHFIELAPSLERYPWQTTRDKLGFHVETLVDTPLEQTPLNKLLREVKRTLDNIKPHAVVISGYKRPSMLAAAQWARTHKAASIIMFASTESDHSRVWWKEQIKRQLIKRYYNAGFINGQASRQYLTKLGMPEAWIWERSAVVNNAYFYESSRRIMEDADKYKEGVELPERFFLYVGSSLLRRI